MKMVAIGLNSYPMANRISSNLDRQRTILWARLVAVAADIPQPKALEHFIKEIFQEQSYEPVGMFRAYLDGTRKPFTKWQPFPAAPWVDKAALLWPVTGDWFYTPLWYLLEDEKHLPDQVIRCVQMLPHHFRDLLLVDSDEGAPSGLRLTSLHAELIHELADPLSPWALGAMACAMRRAELAGEIPLFRLSCVGIIWLLDQLAPTLDPWVREKIQELRANCLEKFSSIVYPTIGGSLQAPISKSDLVRFSVRVEASRKKRDIPFDPGQISNRA